VTPSKRARTGRRLSQLLVGQVWALARRLGRLQQAINAAAGTATRERSHRARRHLNPPDLVVDGFCYRQRRTAVRADGEAVWEVELHRIAHTMRLPFFAAARERSHSTSRHLRPTHLVVKHVGHKQHAAVRADCDAPRAVESRPIAHAVCITISSPLPAKVVTAPVTTATHRILCCRSLSLLGAAIRADVDAVCSVEVRRSAHAIRVAFLAATRERRDRASRHLHPTDLGQSATNSALPSRLMVMH